jgi:hypothetical protein
MNLLCMNLMCINLMCMNLLCMNLLCMNLLCMNLLCMNLLCMNLLCMNLLLCFHINVYAQNVIPSSENQETERIAVLPIVNLLGKQALLSRDEIHVLSTIIQKNVQKHTQRYFQVMTTENIRQLLPPGKTLEDCVGDCEVEYGRSLGAHYMITGSLVKFGKKPNSMRLILKMHDTKKGTLLGIVMIQGVDSEEIENQLIVVMKKGKKH